ncbi:hypothetical protein QTP70_007476, partial [Hemibagrus guttatus]
APSHSAGPTTNFANFAHFSKPSGGFPVYAQKPQMSYGQPSVSNNPFMGGAPAGPYPTGGSSTNPFL